MEGWDLAHPGQLCMVQYQWMALGTARLGMHGSVKFLAYEFTPKSVSTSEPKFSPYLNACSPNKPSL